MTAKPQTLAIFLPDGVSASASILEFKEALHCFLDAAEDNSRLRSGNLLACLAMSGVGLTLGFPLGAPGLLAGGTAVAGAVYSIAHSTLFARELKPVETQIWKVYRILQSATEDKWGKLLEAIGSKEAFCRILKSCAIAGTLDDETRFRLRGGENPFDRCFREAARDLGMTSEVLAQQIRSGAFAQKPLPTPSPQLSLDAGMDDTEQSSGGKFTTDETYLQDRETLSPQSPLPTPSPQLSPEAIGYLSQNPLVQSTFVAPSTPTAYATLIGNPYLSRAAFGAQRTGKTKLYSAATYELASRGTKVFHINLASFGDEDASYWSHAKSIRADLPSLDEFQAAWYVEKAIALVHEFFATRHAILVFDEIVFTGSLSNQHVALLAPLIDLIADKIACLSSTGMKRSQAIWTASPDFVAGGLLQSCKAIKSLSLVYVAIAPGKSVDWNGNAIKFHRESFTNVRRNWEALTEPPQNLKGDRIAFIDGCWREIGDLPTIPQPAVVPVGNQVEDFEELPLPSVPMLEQQLAMPDPPTYLPPPSPPNPFIQFAESLHKPEQQPLKSFIEWLNKHQGEVITYLSVKDTWAKNSGQQRDKKFLSQLIQLAVFRKLLAPAGGDSWRVSSSSRQFNSR
jgi:hypothetical protein